MLNARRTSNNYPLQVSGLGTAPFSHSHLIPHWPHPGSRQWYGYNIVRDQQLHEENRSKDNRNRQEEEAASIHQHAATGLAPEGSGANQDERSLHLAHSSPTIRTRIHTTRYGWTPTRLPSKCDCGKNFNVEHTLSCAKGRFPTLRHNEIRDTTASLLTEICSEVCVEPNLQPVSADQLNGTSANSQENTRLDISANGVWGGGQI